MEIEKVIKSLNINHDIETFELSDVTKRVGNKLYYKNIPSALLYLNHLSLFNEEIIDDGFKVKGTMIDLSRNAVFKLDYFKSVILRQALLGFNEIWLYLEDVYELEDYVKFGYLRGKYTLKDIQELDTYAQSVGVNLVPCIQTLGHMSQFLRWPSSYPFRDQADVLIISDETYKFIQAMLDFCKEAFSTTKIHVGMDETFGFSFGQYYKQHGYTNPEDLFLNHLNQVYQKAKNTGFNEICIWSDMFFRHRSKTEYYYDTTISFEDEFINKIPKDVTLVYWDYYNHKAEVYDLMIKNHQKMNRKVIMASGTWIWTKLAYDREKTLKTATHAINESLKNKVSEIIFTQWNDDGAYCDYETSFLGLVDVTNVMVGNQINPNYLSKINCYEQHKLEVVTKINQLGFDPIMLLWDDILLGIYMNNLVGYNDSLIDPLIENANVVIKEIEAVNYPHFKNLLSYLKNKLELRKILLSGYFKTKNFDEAHNILKAARVNLMESLKSFEENWLRRNKPFGLEVLQNRIYSQLRRLDMYEEIIKSYHDGYVIDFLEEKLSQEPWLSVKYADLSVSSKGSIV
ncbi:beta-N-acetylhexosaminidase [Acholeplasma hippikon]|uniref:N-acetyl-beta-hexosaminidase n=1 Tax=Acholeplasma hippikon TaxID=264636 RepID=A0A449BIA4_9MOLU|nr:beta-N-acetylhexosaminidase [Acholeplasma hippikon]VEU82191.1 N-acetyl-beta-hexosaminidase [Acholeplasma hippikon]